jgi:hypothetical protein
MGRDRPEAVFDGHRFLRGYARFRGLRLTGPVALSARLFTKPAIFSIARSVFSIAAMRRLAAALLGFTLCRDR